MQRLRMYPTTQVTSHLHGPLCRTQQHAPTSSSKGKLAITTIIQPSHQSQEPWENCSWRSAHVYPSMLTQNMNKHTMPMNSPGEWLTRHLLLEYRFLSMAQAQARIPMCSIHLSPGAGLLFLHCLFCTNSQMMFCWTSSSGRSFGACEPSPISWCGRYIWAQVFFRSYSPASIPFGCSLKLIASSNRCEWPAVGQ